MKVETTRAPHALEGENRSGIRKSASPPGVVGEKRYTPRDVFQEDGVEGLPGGPPGSLGVRHDRPWTMGEGDESPGSDAVPKPKNRHGIVGVQYMLSILYCNFMATPNGGAAQRIGGGSKRRRFGGAPNRSLLKRKKATRRTEKLGMFFLENAGFEA